MGKQRDRPPLEARVCRAIRLLAEGRTTDDVARAVRVRPGTVTSWMEDADFQSLLACLEHYRQMQAALDTLNDLTPGAIEALRRALVGDDVRIAVQAAREVLDRVGLIRRREIQRIDPSSEQTIRVEYVNPDGQAVSTPPWSDRHPAPPGTLQGGGVWPPLWENRDGQDPVDREGADGPDGLVDQPDIPYGG
jgi:hypothetical protein